MQLARNGNELFHRRFYRGRRTGTATAQVTLWMMGPPPALTLPRASEKGVASLGAPCRQVDNAAMPSPTCTSCGHALVDGATPCPHCTPPAAAQVTPPPRNRLVPWLIGLPVGAFALLMLGGSLLSTPEGNDQWVAREAIKICTKEVARAPADRKRPDLTADDCAALEAAYRNQYNAAP